MNQLMNQRTIVQLDKVCYVGVTPLNQLSKPSEFPPPTFINVLT